MPSSFITWSPGALSTESMQANDFSVESDVLVPDFGHAGFDGDAFAA